MIFSLKKAKIENMENASKYMLCRVLEIPVDPERNYCSYFKADKDSGKCCFYALGRCCHIVAISDHYDALKSNAEE